MILANSTTSVKGGINVKHNNIILDLQKSTLKVIPNDQPRYNVVTFIECENCIIRDGTLLGDRDEHTYTPSGGTHEFGAGVETVTANNLLIENMIIKDFTGDGILIGGVNTNNVYKPSTKINIINNTIDCSRRNNIGVVVGYDIFIANNFIINCNGTAPQAGIDLEGGSNPRRIIISNNKFENNVGGSVILFNSNETIVDSNITDDEIMFQYSSNVSITNNIIRSYDYSKTSGINQTVNKPNPATKGAMIPIGVKFKINSQQTFDFTTIGAPDNNVGTIFVTTGTGVLGDGDSITRQIENILISGNHITGFKNGITITNGTENVIVVNNKLSEQQTSGIVSAGTRARIEGNHLYKQSIALRISGESNIVKDNTIEDCSNKAIYCIGGNGSIEYNNITEFYTTYGTTSAIEISGGTWIVNGNMIEANEKTGANGIVVHNNSSVITNNTIKGKYKNACITSRINLNIIGNVIEADAPIGIDLFANNSNSVVSKNYINLKSTSGNRVGVRTKGSGTNIKIIDNEIYNDIADLNGGAINTTDNMNSVICRNIIGTGNIISNKTDIVIDNSIIHKS